MLPKLFEPKDYEDKIYQQWETAGYFNPDNSSGTETFTIILPPPNATGTLHLGHAMYVVQDIMVRYQRMRGKKTLWLPGTDHAAIATQNRVEKNLAKLNPPVTRYDLGREQFVQQVEDFVESSRDTIRHQLRKMGFSLDWSREAFTLDATRKAAVSELFVRMYQDGLIYRGNRIVNWCPRCQSTLADDEVEYREETVPFYYFKFGPFTIGTVRPETKLQDKVVIVHPADERYAQWHNQTMMIPWIDGEVEMRVIADAAADMTMGSGAMTITPAHSFIDFDLAQKYNIPAFNIIGKDNKLTAAAQAFAGMDVTVARQKFVEILQQKGLVEKIDEHYTHNLSVCYRCDTPIQPLLSEQWFVNVDQPLPNSHVWAGKTLKQVANVVVETGRIKIIPERFNNTYFHWMNNLHNWCISRQLWYGHRIPAWYKADEVKVQLDCPGEGWQQDPDVLDTWFSSGMWTFSTLGWPNQTTDLKQFHPTQVLETGYDILFFWVARMILMTTYALGDIPFEQVYLHGLVRDKQGRKMSKSLGNGIDPLDMSAKYGTDALRIALVSGTTPGNDSRLYEEKIAGFRNFVTKIWNVGKYVLTQVDDGVGTAELLSLPDRWILSRLHTTIAAVTTHFDKHDYSLAAETAYNFLWHDLADWYIEIAKIQPNPAVLREVLSKTLQLLHPFVPFITEVLWQELQPGTSIMIQPWPHAEEAIRDNEIENSFSEIQTIIIQLRQLRSQYKISYTKTFTIYATKPIDQTYQTLIEQFVKITIAHDQSKAGPQSQIVVGKYAFIVPVGELIDVAAEQQRLAKEITRLQDYITKLKAKLANIDYVQRAPAAVVEQDHQQLAKQEQLVAEYQATLQQLQNNS